MAHAQKPDFVFRRNGRVHLNRRGRQFSRLLAAEVCASAVVMLDTPCSEGVSEYWLPTPFASFPFTSPPVRLRVPSGFKHNLPPLLYKVHFQVKTNLRCVNSGFRRSLNYIFDRLGRYAAYICSYRRFGTTYRFHLQGLTMEPTGCPATSVLLHP